MRGCVNIPLMAPVEEDMTSATSTSPSRSKRERASELLARPPLRQIMRRAARWPGLFVFNYHRVGDRDAQPWDRGLWSADAETFDAQVAALSSCADIVSMHDIPELVGRGRRGRHVLLTFDDGYRDNYEIAYPILRRYGATAAFFIATGFLDRPHVAWWDEIAWMVRRAPRPTIEGVPHDNSRLSCEPGEIERTIVTLVEHYKVLPGEQTGGYLERVAAATGSRRCGEQEALESWMNWDMVREMRAARMDIGGHTVSHPILARLDPAEQEQEIRGCASRLATEVGEPMRSFAYPVGARDTFTETTQRLLGESGVELAFSFYGGFGHFDDWHPMDVPRMHVGYGMQAAELEAALGLPMLFTRA
jgi:peptidoglycan/xylan/chitin deacetylase (PgdA/CDA1 family)